MDKKGFGVEREDIGRVDFGKNRLAGAIKYLNNSDSEFAAFAAVYNVVKDGRVIYENSNHKGGNYGTVTLAAPVYLNGKKGNMAVTIKQTDGNHYKMHRVLTPDGKVLVLDEETAKTNPEVTSDGGVTENGSLARRTPLDDNTSIPTSAAKSNPQFSFSENRR